MSSEPAAMDRLPPELLWHIFSCLDSSLAETRLHDQPKADMLKNYETPLKNVSLVNKRWRAIVLPALFRYAVWEYDRWDLLLVEPGQNTDPINGLPFLRFLYEHDLGRYVDSLTMIVKNSMKGMTRRAEFGLALDVLETTGSSGSSGSSINAGNGESSSPLRDAKTELSRGNTRFPHIQNRAATYNEDNNWVWELLFSLMDPRTITLITSPQMLASLLSRMLFLGDAWSFSRDLIHILSLSRESRSRETSAAPARTTSEPPPKPSSSTENNGPPPPATLTNPPPTRCHKKSSPPSTLFTIRPWTHLLLNEGSSTRVYKTYEFFLRRPPSILGALLGCEEYPNDTPLIPPTVTSLAYVAIFPLASHFNSLVAFLPRIEHFFVQLVPRNDLLLDQEEMRNIQSDLWMERNSCYGLIMRELLVDFSGGSNDDDSDSDSDNGNGNGTHGNPEYNNWRHLRVFESGDSADREAWEMAVQYVRMSGSAWTVEREGVFVRGTRQAAASSGDGNEDGDAGNTAVDQEDHESGQGHALEIFQGQLHRLAFSGTADLPYSPMRGNMDDDFPYPSYGQHGVAHANEWGSYLGYTGFDLDDDEVFDIPMPGAPVWSGLQGPPWS